MSPERVYELARHLTERDRVIAVTLYEQRLLTTDQLQLLFFSSRRRAQDRLLLLYRERVVDRFFPPRRFGEGKSVAHWLLDEAGAVLVAGRLGVDRKKLGWHRRDDWGSYPQLAHRLECNRFVTDLVEATLATVDCGVYLWWSSARAAGRLVAEQTVQRAAGVRAVPDTAFLLVSPAGALECMVEWDRGTETRTQLAWKLDQYHRAESIRREHWQLPYSVLFVVPGPRRAETLRDAYRDFRQRESRWGDSYRNRWPRLVATVPDLRAGGPLGAVWWPIDPDSTAGPFALRELPPSDWGTLSLNSTLGREWCKDTPRFWDRLSPLGADPHRGASPRPTTAPTPLRADDLRRPDVNGSMDDHEAAEAIEQ